MGRWRTRRSPSGLLAVGRECGMTPSAARHCPLDLLAPLVRRHKDLIWLGRLLILVSAVIMITLTWLLVGRPT
jgi:hypothetical protein